MIDKSKLWVESTWALLDEDEMKKINTYERTPLKSSDVNTFTIGLCSNEIDMDFERFSISSLTILKKLYLGVPLLLGYKERFDTRMARIYHTELVSTMNSVTQANEILTQLIARAYIPKVDHNRETIELLKNGIAHPVNIACSIKRKICALCGKEECDHKPGCFYNGQLAHKVLFDPIEAYECSIVLTEESPCPPTT